MDDIIPRPAAPGEWLDILAESEADVAAGHIVSGDEIIRELRETAARLEAARAAARQGREAGRG